MHVFICSVTMHSSLYWPLLLNTIVLNDIQLEVVSDDAPSSKIAVNEVALDDEGESSQRSINA